MQKLVFITLFYLICSNIHAQLKRTVVCPAVSVDVLDGRVNGLRITDNPAQIKSKLPCFTKAEDETAAAKCGGGVYYKDKDIYFFTGRDYVEIGPKFKGKLSVPLMGASRTSLFKWLGHPKIKDVKWDAFTTAYGILILYYSSSNKVNKIQLSTKTEDTIQLCE